MDEALKLTRAFKEMRRDRGVTSAKLEARRWLLDDLVASTPEAGLAALQEIVADMGNGPIGNTMRASLGIGIPWVGNLEARRDWAAEASRSGDFFVGSRSTQTRIEKDEALPELVRRILERRDRLTGTGTVEEQIQEQTRQNLAEAGLLDAFTPAKPIDTGAALQPLPPPSKDEIDHDDAPEPLERADQAPAGRRAKMRAFYYRYLTSATPGSVKPMGRPEKAAFIAMASAVAALGVLMTLRATGVIPDLGHHHSADSSVPSTPPPAVVSDTPADKLDNTHGWGPPRQTFTMKTPAPYPVFNSITDSNAGDERNFIQCHDTTNGDPWGTEIVEHPGDTYQCYLTFDNDLTPTYDAVASPYQGENPLAMLHDATVRIALPSANPNVGLVAYLSASNVLPPAPGEVWSTCNFVGPDRITLSYVTGSARMFTNVTPKDGVPLKGDATLTTSGAPLGDNQDGYLGQHAGYIMFNVVVQRA